MDDGKAPCQTWLDCLSRVSCQVYHSEKTAFSVSAIPWLAPPVSPACQRSRVRDPSRRQVSSPGSSGRSVILRRLHPMTLGSYPRGVSPFPGDRRSWPISKATKEAYICKIRSPELGTRSRNYRSLPRGEPGSNVTPQALPSRGACNAIRGLGPRRRRCDRETWHAGDRISKQFPSHMRIVETVCHVKDGVRELDCRRVPWSGLQRGFSVIRITPRQQIAKVVRVHGVIYAKQGCEILSSCQERCRRRS